MSYSERARRRALALRSVRGRCAASSASIRTSRASATPAALAEEFVAIYAEPLSRVSRLERSRARRSEPSGRMRLIARFLGMFGPQGALPLTTTEESLRWLLERDDAFPRFVEFSSGAFSRCSFAPGRIARPVAQNDRPERGSFRDLYRLDDRRSGRRPFATPTRSPISPRWSLPGCSRPGSRAPRACARSCRRLFGVRVEIDEFVGAWLGFRQARTHPARRRPTAASASDCISRREHVQRERQVPHPRLCDATSNITSGFCPARRSRAGRSPTRCFSISAKNTTGIWSSRFRPARSRRSVSGRAQSSAGRVGWRPTGRGPTRRSARMRDFTSSAAWRRTRRTRATAELGGGSNMGADISVESVTGKLNRVGYEAFHSGPAAGQGRRQPQHRTRPLDAASSAEGPHRPRADRRSFQAQPRQAARATRRRSSTASARTKPRCRAFPTRSPTRSIAAGTTRRCCSARRRSAPAICWWRC